MAPLPMLFLALAAAAADPGPKIDQVSCSEANIQKIQQAWPLARKRLAAAKDAAEKAYAGTDPQLRRKVLAYAKFLDGGLDSLPDVARVLGLMDGILERGRFICGSKADKACQSRNGYVRRGEGDVIHLCPAVMKGSKEAAEQRVRNMTHEAAHLVDARISQPEGEGYCVVFDCELACPGKTPYLVADNWAQFTHCAGGEKPDEAFLIEASASSDKKR